MIYIEICGHQAENELADDPNSIYFPRQSGSLDNHHTLRIEGRLERLVKNTRNLSSGLNHAEHPP